MHYREHADSEYVLHVQAYHLGIKFTDNKHTKVHIHSHRHTQLYILVPMAHTTANKNNLAAKF